MTDCLPQHPELNIIMVPHGPKHLSGARSSLVVDLFEVEATAKTRYLLQSVAEKIDPRGD
jgi:hypothetical protein